MLSVELTNQHALEFDESCLKQAAANVLEEAGLRDGSLSIAVVDDPTIHALNRQYLEHDYPTDVLSFLLDRKGERLEGEVIVSADTARRVAGEIGWPAEHELLLYVVHGVLHLVGHDDATDELRAAMRDAERRHLTRFGVERRDEPSDE